jgi:hypothetical protein
VGIRQYRDMYYPSTDMEVCEKNIDDFFKFIYERHMVWRRRFIEKLPQEKWTENLILKNYKYTNVYRELDRGTLWYLTNIAEPFKKKYDESEHSRQMIRNEGELFKQLVWETVLYRLCNRIETFERIGLPDLKTYNHDELHNSFWEKMHEIELDGKAVMTSAHLTCPTTFGKTKVEGYIEAINDLHKKLDGLVEEIRKCKTSEQVFNELKSIHCVGNFIAYEVLCDLMYTLSIGYSGKPFVEDDWANVGPGAFEGIRLLYPSTTGKRNIYARMVQLRDEQDIHFKRLGITFPYYEKFTKGHLSLRSLEHDLCEYSKFWLHNRGLGKQRMIFNADQNRIIEKVENEKQVKYRIIVDPNTGDSLNKVYF